MTATMRFADVVEGIRATIATYAQALDDGRTDDVVSTFCADGVCEIPGMGIFTGHEALHGAFSGWKPKRPQRHLVLNTAVADWDDHEATAVSDVLVILLGSSGWTIQLVGRYRDVLHHHEGTWRFHRRAVTFVTDSSKQDG